LNDFYSPACVILSRSMLSRITNALVDGALLQQLLLELRVRDDAFLKTLEFPPVELVNQSAASASSLWHGKKSVNQQQRSQFLPNKVVDKAVALDYRLFHQLALQPSTIVDSPLKL
jgi:hypothetical protein